MRGLHILVFSFAACAAVDLYIDSPVTLLDCRSSRQEDQWMVGNTEATTKMTEKPADPREFYEAARDGDLQYIENEISRLGPGGLNLDWQNDYDYGYPDELGRTALLAASYANNPSIVSALLEAGANPNIQEYMEGRTPIYIAARYNQLDVLRLLLDPKYKADVNLANNNPSSGHRGVTPVFWAATNGHTTALELLLAQGGDPNAVDNYGTSPLMQASTNGHTACVRALIAAGAHVNYVNPRDGRTALHWAAYRGMKDVAQVLLEAGATKTEDEDGNTPTVLARKKGHQSVAWLIGN